MFGTQEILVGKLRTMAVDGGKPSEMVRMLLSRGEITPIDGMIDRNLLVQYFTEAFCFTDGQAYGLFGWLPNGSGELKDADIDYLLTKRIQQTKTQWICEMSKPLPQSRIDAPENAALA